MQTLVKGFSLLNHTETVASEILAMQPEVGRKNPARTADPVVVRNRRESGSATPTAKMPI